MHAVGAEHVCDLVRVGDDGRRPERQHEPGELARQEPRGLEVHVRVDEAGHDVPPGRVDALAAVVASEAGDPAVDHGHVALEPLAGEDREHPPARDDEIGRLVAAGDGDPAREVAVMGGAAGAPLRRPPGPAGETTSARTGRASR